jgi:ATP adenylyltransferase
MTNASFISIFQFIFPSFRFSVKMDDTMDHLWSPWRMKYIQQHEPSTGCVFCLAVQQEDSSENLVVARGQRSFAILNRYPYTSGHLMVVPYLHVPSIEDLDVETRHELIEMANLAMGVLRAVYRPEAFNVGANIGAAAGAGIAAHVHLHVVPRWNGDTNFMSSIGETRIMPEELSDTYRRVREQWV